MGKQLSTARDRSLSNVSVKAPNWSANCASGFGRQGASRRKSRKAKAPKGAKFSDYFDFRQAVRDLPSHRALALLRGRNEGFLGLDLDVDVEPGQTHPAELKIMTAFNIANRGRAGDGWLIDTVKQAWKSKLHKSLTSDLIARLKDNADAAAINIFKSNLKDLMLAAPAGPRVTMGLDPGIRTGVKVAVVDQTGKVVGYFDRLSARTAQRLDRRADHAGHALPSNIKSM